jgi:hypothetical protein
MRHRMRKRSDGDGDHDNIELLGAVGLSNFARLGFPDPPNGLEISATYESASGCIAVSFRGEGVYASRADM